MQVDLDAIQLEYRIQYRPRYRYRYNTVAWLVLKHIQNKKKSLAPKIETHFKKGDT